MTSASGWCSTAAIGSLLMFRNDEWSSLHIRVDDHPDPLLELDRPERVSKEEWIQYRSCSDSSACVGVTDHEVIDAAAGAATQYL
jgi:hypothetical protein